MSKARQLPQAKYELLSGNKRSSVWSAVGLASSVVIICLLTASTTYFLWTTMMAARTNRVIVNIKKFSNITSVQHSSWRYRLEAYGSALIQNKTVEEQLVVNQENVSSVGLQKMESDGYKLVCYYPLPNDANSSTDLMPEDIDPFLCTHIIMATISVENCSIKPSTEELEMYKRVVALKENNHELNILLSIAGIPSVGGFNDMVTSPERRTRFIQETVSLVAKCGLDGVDFDWEFPAWDSKPSEKTYFAQFLSELRQEIVEKNVALIVSVAVAAPKPIVDVAYDVPSVARSVDFISIMSYDYHFYIWYLPLTGYNSPLYSQPGDDGYFLTLNLNWSVNYWLLNGMPKEKIMIGLPTYGHTFSLMNPDNHNLNAPAVGVGSIGSDGYISYDQVCWFISNGGAAVEFDRNSKVPYAYNAKDWVSYENEQSLAYKAEYIVSGGFAGAMVFSLSTDDYKGKCSSGNVKLPLTRRIKLVLTDDEL